MPGLLAGKTAIITGGNSGIGRATALRFAEEGAQVVIAARREAQGQEVVNDVKSAGGEAIFVRTDVSRPADVEAMVARAVDAYGRIDCAFNNAGVASGHGPIHETTEADWDWTVDINLKGVWLCMKYEIAEMLAQGGGVIVNNSSTAGLFGYADNPIYAASKYGVTGLTTSVALQYATQSIRVNAVCPGWIRTHMTAGAEPEEGRREAQALDETPMRRMASADEVAEAVVWLCSDKASFVTGVALPVDGGLVAR